MRVRKAKQCWLLGLRKRAAPAPSDFLYQEMGSKKESLGTLEPILLTGPLSRLSFVLAGAVGIVALWWARGLLIEGQGGNASSTLGGGGGQLLR